MNRRGKTFIISGPSGVGKSTVLHALFEGRDDLYFSVSATTRAPREGERDGVDYHFIHADRFRSMIEEDAFLEYAEYVGNFYGTPKKIYNQTAVTYNRRFFNNTVGVSAGFYFHYDGVGLGLQQILKVSVNLQKTVYRPKK